MKEVVKRERLSSRLGFILLSVGCAVGLGNVWRFPYVVGQNGGAIFVIFYIFFLAITGLPIMVMEFAIGRSSQKSIAEAFNILEPKNSHWHKFKYIAMTCNYVLMFFYTVIAGWILNYFFATACGRLSGVSSEQIVSFFDTVQSNAWSSVFWTLLVIILGFLVCVLGLQAGVEKITKFMMLGLFFIILALVIKTLGLSDAIKGVEFYLKPDLEKVKETGLLNVANAAMGQAFFTLSVGCGSMAIFGSYLNKERRLFGEAIHVTVIDTLVAILAGLIIFPACASFNVAPDSGPSLVFITLPNIFNVMSGGRIWGALFFLFMCFAAFSTVIAVFENIVSFAVDMFSWSRKRSVLINILIVSLGALPCALGYNALSFIKPLGKDSHILDLGDFIVSQNLLPIGALIFVLFCTSKYGWSFDNFLEEANCGKGFRFPKQLRFYLTFILPVLVLIVFIQGYLQFLAK